jgi:hypothetical protein
MSIHTYMSTTPPLHVTQRFVSSLFSRFMAQSSVSLRLGFPIAGCVSCVRARAVWAAPWSCILLAFSILF